MSKEFTGSTHRHGYCAVETSSLMRRCRGGAYLTPREMEVLTDAWKPYRSLGVYYMWPAGEDF